MGFVNADITYKEKGKVYHTRGQRLIFSPNRCFTMNGDAEDRRLLNKLAELLEGKPGLAIAGTGPFAEYFLAQLPRVKKCVRVVIQDDWKVKHSEFAGLPVCEIGTLPAEIKTVFVAEPLTEYRLRWGSKLKGKVEVLDLSILEKVDPLGLPMRAWSKDPDCIYPMEIPEIKFDSGMDFILIDCPARNLALMPNGLAYVHNILKKTSLKFQTVDLDILAYHRYHSYRLLDAKTPPVTATGRAMHIDPWLAEAYTEWLKEDTLNYFTPELEEITAKLIAAKPKILGCSIQGCNINFTRELVRRVQKALPELIVVGGGYSAYQPNVAHKLFPEADYICIGEADVTAAPLLEALKRGEFPRDTPGVLSKYDTPNKKYTPGGMPHELDQIEMARYDWTDLKLYRNHNHYQLTPIIATRGCRWSKCTFCGERFFWRARSPKLVVDEFEYLHDNGCDLFMFNESDLNGNPKILVEICEEIQRRKLKIRLTGQLRISRHSDRKFFDSLRAGGFTALRFGVDAWSENTLKLQKKGYTVPMVIQNLKDVWEAGIYTEVNTVIGIPGETDDDIERTIELKGICKPHIGRVANINKLMMIHGSVYWEEPDKHNIKFIGGTKEEMFAKYPDHIPAELWYSEGPFIDEKVRVERFKRVVEGMAKLGYDIGPFAAQNVDAIDKGRASDKMKDEGQIFLNWDEEAEQDKRQPDMRVDSVIKKVEVSTDAPLRIFRKGDEFYGIYPEEKKPTAAAVKAGEVAAATPDNVKGLATPPAYRRAVDLSKGLYTVYRTQGAAMVISRARGKFNRLLAPWRAGRSIEDGEVVIKRDFTPLFEYIDKHPAGFALLKVRDTFYLLHHLEGLDKEKADNNGYGPGRCFTGRTASEAIAKMEAYTGYVAPAIAPPPPAPIHTTISSVSAG